MSKNGTILNHYDFPAEWPTKEEMLEEIEDSCCQVEQMTSFHGRRTVDGIAFSTPNCELKLTDGDRLGVTFQPVLFSQADVVAALQALAGRIEREGLPVPHARRQTTRSGQLRLKAKLLQQIWDSCEIFDVVHFFGSNGVFTGIRALALIEPTDSIRVELSAKLTAEEAASMILELAFKIAEGGFPVSAQ